ncbi:hypothetical protein PTKIN_Ptkin16aG0051600 [Pterospermum kingtungense]
MSALVNQQSSSSMSEKEEAFGYALCLRTSGFFPFVLDAAVQLGLFDILAKAGPQAPLSSYQIAYQLHANNPEAPSHVDRMLRLLACYGLVSCVSRNLDGDNGDGNYKVERLYGLALPGKAFVRVENGGALAAFTMDKVKMEVWLHLKDLVLESGNLFEKVHGMPTYQYVSLNPEYARKFNTSMNDLSKIIMKKVLEKYQGFQGISTLVDVGGGYGFTLNIIVSKYPFIKGINYDLPHAIQHAPSYPNTYMSNPTLNSKYPFILLIIYTLFFIFKL